MEEST
jgi:hypothetical protein